MRLSPIDPRARICGSGANAFCGRVGLLVHDEDRQAIIAITAAQIAACSPQLYIDGIAVGTRREEELPFAPQASRSADDMLWPVGLYGHFKLSEKQLLDRFGKSVREPKLIRKIDDWLGKRVLVQTTPNRPVVALLRSTSARFRMPPPGQLETAVFCDALEISPLGSEPVTQNGDAGAVVTTLDGDPIGTIICGTDSESYAAPLNRILDSLGGIRMLTARMIAVYNREIDGHAVHTALKHSNAPMIDFERAKAEIASADPAVAEKAERQIEDRLLANRLNNPGS